MLEAVLASGSEGAQAVQAYNRTLAAMQSGEATQAALDAAHRLVDHHHAWALDSEVDSPPTL